MDGIWDQYEEITRLKCQNEVCLVLGREDKKVYVRKCLKIYNPKVYESLKIIRNIHIPRVYDLKEQDDRLYVIEEYVGGETLQEKMERGEVFTEKEVFEIILQLCEAITCLHGQIPAIIHRDIKLSNVMITEEGIVKLIDYNAARYFMEGMAQDTMLIGTAGYAAPEQFGFAQTDVRTDIYSLGVMMNYMLTGQSYKSCPYDGKAGKVIRKCTYMDPEKRYQKIQEVEAEVRKLLYPGESKKKWIKKKLLPLPGFRSRKLWRMVAGAFVYLFLIYSVFIVVLSQKKVETLKEMIDALVFYVVALFAFVWIDNRNEIKSHIPFAGSKSKMARGMGAFVFFVLCLMLIAVVDMFLELFFGISIF